MSDGAEADEPDGAVTELADALDHHLLLGFYLAAFAYGGIGVHGVSQAGEHEEYRLLGDPAGVDACVVADGDAEPLGSVDVDGVVGDAFGMDEFEVGHALHEVRAHRADGVGHDEVGVRGQSEDVLVG